MIKTFPVTVIGNKLFYKLKQSSILKISLVVCFIVSFELAHAQWLDWQDDTSLRLTLSSVATTDPEEKDMWAADLNNDGDDDLVVVRKQPFSSPTQPGKSNLLLMNINGIMTDQTSIYAPGFISNINFARDVFIGDFDGDNWNDIVIANTFDQQPSYYKNRGADSLGNWLGLINESTLRFPYLNDDSVKFCALWGGDVTGDGALDIYFVNYKPNSSGGIAKDYLLINDGTGHFTNQSQARLGILRNSAFGTACQIHDMDGDGDKDIIKNSTLYNVAPWNARGVLVLFNNGTGNFTNWQNLVPISSPYMFEVADFNLDGKKDLYVVDDGSDYVLTTTAYVPNVSLTTVKTNLNFASTNGFGGNVHVADLDLDGDMDIGVADVDVDIPPCNSSRRMAIYRNDNGAFTDIYGSTLFGWADNSFDFAWLDINNDGLQDFITGFCGGYGVFMNDNCALAPTPSDYDQDGLADACDPCPTNPDPACAPPTNYPTVDTSYSAARQWNELLLASIRKDFARPTVHARNLFHISAAMWDAWSAYDNTSCEFLLGQTVDGFTCPYNGIPPSANIETDRRKAISYAAYRILKNRFANSPQSALLNTGYDVHMDSMGYDKNFTSIDYSTGNAAALGNYIGQCYIAFGLQDGSNQQNGYANTSYTPVNPPLNVDVAGNPNITNLNRWQPLTLDLFIDQSGNQIPGATPPFLSPEWGQVIPFALNATDLTVNQRNGFNYNVYHDPGPPPTIQMDGLGTSEQYKYGFALVAAWSAHLDPTDGVMWDISPATQGNRDTVPTTFAAYPGFYNQTAGGTTNIGYSLNPKTGLPYTPNFVKRGDYARVLAEFWADGPESETPPGHWFTLFNYVSDHPLQTKKYKGLGIPLNDLEWDVKGYFSLGGAMHDVAVAVWGMKGWYDYIRPLSAIRAMAALGQSTNTGGPSYHPAGIPLIPGYIEVVMSGDSLANISAGNIGKIKLKAWRGHNFINNVDVDEAGVGWILAENWLPYQRPSFVTPPFAGYISGHSTYSRAAAEILTDFTGDEFFPGGLGTFTAQQNDFLVFEDGPSQDVTLQWATYQDASDESSLSRIWGGIHPPCDDIPGRILGVEIAADAFSAAEKHFFNIPNDGNCDVPGCTNVDACNYTSLATQDNGTCSFALTYYHDADSDGYGNAASSATNCFQPLGYVLNNTDCNDTNSAVNQGAIEICCNGIDDNCDGSIDNGCSGIPVKPGVISTQNGNTKVCPGDSKTYSINSVVGATSYTWIPPAGAVIFNGQGTNTVTLNYSSGFIAADSLKVFASNLCGNGPFRAIKIFRNNPATPSEIAGNFNGVCPSTSSNYSVTNVNGISYNWIAPAGATILIGQGTNAVTVSYSGAFTSGFIEVTASNGCGTSITKKKKVNSIPNKPFVISGPVNNNCNVTASYSIDTVPGALSYSWSTNIAGAIVTPNNNNASISFPSFVSGIVSVAANNVCGSSAVKNLTVKGTAAAPSVIYGSNTATPCVNETYSIDPIPGATSYTWYKPTGSTIVSGAGTNSIIVHFGNASGNITAKGNNACGAGVSKSISVAVNSCARVIGQHTAMLETMNIYPNPTEGELIFEFNAIENYDNCLLEIYNSTGQSVYSKSIKIVQGQNLNEINLNGYSSGIYLIKLKTENGIYNQRIAKH